MVSSACVQWPAVTTVARSPFRVHNTYRTCFSQSGMVCERRCILCLPVCLSTSEVSLLPVLTFSSIDLLTFMVNKRQRRLCRNTLLA